MTRALFLDRDGVINREKNYLYRIEDFEFIDGVFESCRYFQKKGYLIIIVTNQAGIARGKYTEQDYKVLTDWMLLRFENQGITITKVYHCPHHPEFTVECICRKPKTGMFIQAEKEFNIDMSSSIMVGDKSSDIEAAEHSGIGNSFLITTGHAVDFSNLAGTIHSLTDLLVRF